MPSIVHRVGIAAPPRQVFAALATIDGLRGWWVTTTLGDSRVGREIDFGFCRMKVLKSQPGKRVHWRCISGPREWIGTEVTFGLRRATGQTWVLFEHAKWRRPVEFMHHCSTKWATFLLSLKELLEQGSGRPAPYDLKIHVGD